MYIFNYGVMPYFVIAQTVVYLCHDLMVLLTVDILFYLIEVEKYHYASERANL